MMLAPGLDIAAVVGLAVALDAALGEPPTRMHPVAWFGTLVDRLETGVGDSSSGGAVIALLGPIGAAAIVGALVHLGGAIHWTIGLALAGLGLFLTVSRRRLLAIGTSVVGQSAVDPDGARDRLPALVGRDPRALEPAEIRSAAIESMAENLADGFIAPLLAFVAVATISVPLGVAAATWVKAVNTLDAMLGYPDRRIGTASARLDDAVMWIPARVTAGLIALAGRRPRAALRARPMAQNPASPNSGWPMATLAAVIDRRLEKPESYVIGEGRPEPTPRDGASAIVIVNRAAWLGVMTALAWAMLVWVSG